MITRKKKITLNVNKKCLKYIHDDISSILFFDIETTGFSAKSSDLYMIGTGHYIEDAFETTQYFVEALEDEEHILNIFINLISNYKAIVHYNGNTFDIPFIKTKCEQYGIEFNIPESVKSYDIYKEIIKFKNVFNLPDYRQKSIEKFLMIERDDEMDGGDLIKIYKDYLKETSDDLKETLFLHNYDDVRGLIGIMDIFKYINFLDGEFADYTAEIRVSADSEGESSKELFFRITACDYFPAELTVCNKFGILKFKADKCFLSCRSHPLELKFFFNNPKDYYYLPSEDMAVHKSVAIYVDKNYRKKATASNCYVKKQGDFFLSAGCREKKLFKTDYKDPDDYILYSEELFQDKEFLDNYLECILKTF